jgi:peroxiredoxin
LSFRSFPFDDPIPILEDRMKHARILLVLVAALAVAVPAAADCGSCGSSTAHSHDGEMHAAHMAPDFELSDHAGNTHKLSEYRGKVVVLEWTNPQCPFVQRHYADGNTTMIDLQKKYGDEVVWLAVDSSNFVTSESASEWAGKKGIEYPILLDASGEVGRLYEAKTTPHMFVIGADGKLLYEGAIDDDRAGKSDSPTNYVDAAVRAALAGEPVETAKTTPDGCSVKYGKSGTKSASAS